MTHPQAWASFFVSTALLLCATGGVLAAADERPNVLLIIADDLNDYAFGEIEIDTPGLDRFAQSAIRFSLAYCASPVCGPSRAATFSGLYPHHTGAYRNGAAPWMKEPFRSIESLPEVFRRSGYATFGVGKLFHSPTESEQWDRAWDEQPYKGGFGPFPPEEDRFGAKFWGITPWTGPDSDFPDCKNAEHAIEFLGREHDRPFFLCYGLWRPHNPYTAPKRFFERHDPAEIPLPPPGYRPNDLDDVPSLGKELAAVYGNRWKTSGAANPDRWRRFLHAYLANTSFADWNIGRVIDALDESPYGDNTLVIVWSDNGFHMGEKDHYGKGTLWEQAALTPLLIRAPGGDHAGSVCRRPVGSIDFFPTIRDYCGLEPTEHTLDGRSIRALLEDPQAAWDTPALTTYGEGFASLRDERYRLIRYPDGTEELYDHDTDPDEFTNVVDDETHRPAADRLRSLMPTEYATTLGGRQG